MPCYKEDLEVVENTVKAILNADYPHNTTRTVYLCDDGNDPLKRDFASRVSDVVYVTGRYREKGGLRGWLVVEGWDVRGVSCSRHAQRVCVLHVYPVCIVHGACRVSQWAAQCMLLGA